MTVDDAHPDDRLLLACRDIGRAMDLFDEAAAQALRVGRSDLRALNLLEHGPVGATTLADHLGLSRPSVTALVDRLEAAGYVSRVPAPGDRRAVRIELRAATWRAFAEVYRPLGERVGAATAGLPERDRGAVVSALTAIADAFDAARLGMAAG